MKKKYILPLFSVLVLSFLISCQDETKKDTSPPGVLTVNEIIPTHGGAKIAYTLPSDDDILFVKARYVNSLGNEVFKVSSHYRDTIEIDGFNDTLPKQVELFVVDYANNHSGAVKVEVTPLISYIYLVQESMSIVPDLGGVKLSWTNPSKKTVHVYLYYTGNGLDTFKIISSGFEHYSYNLMGLDSLPYSFSSVVEDFSGNKTTQKFIGEATPMFEEKIDKASWSLVSTMSVNGNAWEGLTTNFWDDVIDTHEDASDNSYFIINRDQNGGALNYPLDIVIDLNKSVIVNRLIVWQRAYWWSNEEPNGVSTLPYYYQSENLKDFDIYTSNDLSEWTLAGQFSIPDRKDQDGNVAEEYVQEALNGHSFVLDQVTEPFRYLKFAITSSFGSEINVYGSELSLYGLDNVQP